MNPTYENVILEKIETDCDDECIASKMTTPKKLAEDGYTIMNVRTTSITVNGKTREAKSPIDRRAIGITGWEKLPHDALVAKMNYEEPYTLGFGIRLGEQGNKKLICSLDFDCCKKMDGEYFDCYETLKLFDDYRDAVGDEVGMFSSSTSGNTNVLIDYTDAPLLGEKLKSLGKKKICREGCGLELLIYHNQVIPPTTTKCKRSGEMGKPRTFYTPFPFKVVTDDDPATQFIMDYINTCYIEKKEKPKKKLKVVKEKKEVPKSGKVDELLDMINIEYWDDYNSWTKLVWAMMNVGYSRDVCWFYSQKSHKYDDEGFDKIYDNPPSVITLTQGTINHYAKKSSPEKYEKYIQKKIMENKSKVEFIKNRTDLGFAEAAIELLGDDIIFTETTELFIYYKRFWRCDDKMVQNIIQGKIIDLCNAYIKKLWEEVRLLDEEEKIKQKQDEIKDCGKTIAAISSSSKLKSVLEQMKICLMSNQKNIKFDAKTPHVICFNNIAFDLNTREEYDVKKDDYITMRTGYDYEEPSEEQVKLIEKIFIDIFPDEEMRKTYISILRSGLSGERQEKLFMANGGGRNGKGLLNELMMECVGNYGQKLNMAVLTEKIKSGANAEVNNLHKKRWVVSNEPNDDEVIKAGNMKRLTGDERIDARGLYQDGKMPVILNMTLVMELNKMIAFQGRIDDAVVSRLVKVDFPVFFTDSEYMLQNNPNARKGNSQYKKEWWKEEHKHAFFKYLLDYEVDGLYICDKARDSAKEYLLDNDDMYNWFKDNYIKVEDPTPYDFVQIKDVYDEWKMSDLYSNMSKANKRKANMKNFKQSNILENNEMKKYFVEKYQKYENGERIISKNNVLINWRKKPNTCLLGEISDEE